MKDEPLIQMLGREFLEEAGFKVDTAGSATEAMNKLALVSGGFDAIIVDIGLPDRTEEAWREIRSNNRWQTYVADDLYRTLRTLGVRFRDLCGLPNILPVPQMQGMGRHHSRLAPLI